MKTLKSLLVFFISSTLILESAQAVPVGTTSPIFQISLPGSLGYVSDAWASGPFIDKPDLILIQDLHANRSVQFAISGILRCLKKQGLLPDQVAVEGESGPVDLVPMQNYPNPSVRKKAADYLVKQGEMPGAMHFAITEGAGRLVGAENKAYYQADLEMFRQSYKGRATLRNELKKIQDVLTKLKRNASTQANAAILEKDIDAVNLLINIQVIPQELPQVLGRASAAVEHLEQVLPASDTPQNDNLVEALSASINFYALALLRNEELFTNTLLVRKRENQKTSVLVTGGFHTQALAELCKKNNLSYAVITPNIRRDNQIDKNLYIERLLNLHLTPDQVASGLDWTAMETSLTPATDTIQYVEQVKMLWQASIRQATRSIISTAVVTGLLVLMGTVSSLTANFNLSQATPVARPSPLRELPGQPLPVRMIVLGGVLPDGSHTVLAYSFVDLKLAGSAGIRVIFPLSAIDLQVTVALNVGDKQLSSQPVAGSVKLVNGRAILEIPLDQLMRSTVGKTPRDQVAEPRPFPADQLNSVSGIVMGMPEGSRPDQDPIGVELIPGPRSAEASPLPHSQPTPEARPTGGRQGLKSAAGFTLYEFLVTSGIIMALGFVGWVFSHITAYQTRLADLHATFTHLYPILSNVHFNVTPSQVVLTALFTVPPAVAYQYLLNKVEERRLQGQRATLRDMAKEVLIAA